MRLAYWPFFDLRIRTEGEQGPLPGRRGSQG